MPAYESMKGFRDFLPEEMTARQEMFDAIERVVQRFGFRQVGTPSVEPFGLYEVKSGDELLEQTYNFEDKGGRHITLVPEQTPSRARLVASNKSLASPIKWYSISKRWRYEQPQKGRLREFFQTDIDIFGTDSVRSDAEILAVAAAVMDELQVLDAVEILVNDRRLLEGILDAHGIEDKDAVMDVIDDKEKMTADEFQNKLQELGFSQDEAANVDDLTDVRGKITAVVDRVEELAPDDPEAQDAIDRLQELVRFIESYGIGDQVVLDLSIVRGLDYYTGLVFEVFDTEGELRAVCGGGRYDDLVELYGGEPVPAVGFAIGDAVIEELMRREGVWPEEALSTDVCIVTVEQGLYDRGLELAEMLREAGLVVETDVVARNVGNQFDYANKIGASYAVIIGERDLDDGVMTVQDLKTGDESQVPVEDVADELIERCEDGT